jgi:phosphohistidine phosphatase
MTLYVVQHGKSMPASEDPEKGLSKDGQSETKRIAEVAAGYQVPVSRILHSGKQRARQTAEIFDQYLSPKGGTYACDGMNPLDDVNAFARTLPLDQQVMVVGHLPFLERLIGLLVGDNPEKVLFKLQNSGVVCLDYLEESKHSVIRWALMPNIGG